MSTDRAQKVITGISIAIGLIGGAFALTSAVARADVSRLDSRVDNVERRVDSVEMEQNEDRARLERWLERVEGSVSDVKSSVDEINRFLRDERRAE